MGVKITIDKSSVSARIKGAWKSVIPKLAEQVLTDCNFYCRVDQGVLRASPQTASNFTSGVLVWDTPYARRVYYTGSPSHDMNPNAALQWCEVAHNAHGKEWALIAQKLLGRAL